MKKGKSLKTTSDSEVFGHANAVIFKVKPQTQQPQQ